MKNNYIYWKSGQLLAGAIRNGQFAETIDQAEKELEAMYDGGYKSFEEYREQGCFIVKPNDLTIIDNL